MKHFMLLFALCALLLLLPSSGYSQPMIDGLKIPESGYMQVVETKDGGMLIGRIVSQSIEEKSLVPRGDDRKKKIPSLSFALSFVMPGAGQLYNGQKIKAAAMFGGFSAGILVLTAGAKKEGGDMLYSGLIETLLGFGISAGFWTWSWIDAPIAAVSINRKIERSQKRITAMKAHPVLTHNRIGVRTILRF